MPGPINFDPYLGWVNITDPNNIPQDARVIGANDLLRYENLGIDVSKAAMELDGADKAQLESIAVLESGKLSKVDAAKNYATNASVTTEIKSRVDPLVATAIAADVTIAQAAIAAVSGAAEGMDLVESGDPRMPLVGQSPGVIFAVMDSNKRMTWIAADDTDGGPTEWSLNQIGAKLRQGHLSDELIDGLSGTVGESIGVSEVYAPGVLASITDSNGIRTWLEANDSDGGPTSYAVSKIVEAIGADTGGGSGGPSGNGGYLASDTYVSNSGEILTLLANMKRVSMWSSSSGDWGSPQIQIPFLSYGASYFNRGKYGEKAEHIAARIGSRPALLSAEGGVIPESGPVTVTASNMTYSDLMKTFTGTLAGVKGSLAAEQALDVYQFTRSAPGATIPIPSGTPFLPEIGPQHRTDVLLLWMGKNDLAAAGTEAKVIEITDQTHDWAAPLAKRVLVMGHFVNGGSGAINATRDRIYRVNEAHAKRYGNRYVDVHAYVTGPDIWTDSGVTPTQADLDQQALGNKPDSLSQDSGHLNAAGYTAIAKLLDRTVKSLGWYN